MALVKIDQRPANVPMYLSKGDDMTPWTALLHGVNLSTAAGYTWAAHIYAAGVSVKTLTVTAVVSGLNTLVTISGLSAVESTALAATGLTYDLLTTSPVKRTYLEGAVNCG